VHRLLILTILNYSVMIRTLDALKAGVVPCQIAENVFDFLLKEVIRTGLVVTNVEIFAQLRHFLRRESQLS
jgi:hypothetical protein